MTISSLAYWVSIFGIVVISLLAVFRRRQLSMYAFIVFALSLTGWLIAQNMMDNGHAVKTWIGMSFVLSEALAPAYLLFTYLYPNKKTVPLKLKIVSILPLAIFGPLSFTSLLFQGYYYDDVNGLKLDVGPLYIVQSAILLGYLISGCILLFSRLSTVAKSEKNQVYLLIVGSVIPLMAIGLTGTVFINSDVLQVFRPLSVLMMVAMVAYAMIYYKLFDVRSFVIRAVAYLFTSVVLALLYVVPILFATEWLMRIPFKLTPFLVAVAVATIGALNFEKVRKRFNSITNKIFFQDAYDSALLLGHLNRRLATTTHLTGMLEDSSSLIKKEVKVEYCAFVIKSSAGTDMRYFGPPEQGHLVTTISQATSALNAMDEKVVAYDFLPEDLHRYRAAFAKDDIAMIIRLVSGEGTAESLGFMILGYKKNGNPYDGTDLHTLRSAADALAIAVQNALRFEEIQDFNLNLQQRIYDATAQLRRTNAKLKALDETKDDFISMASHQLRTPLTSVKGYLSMVLEGDAGKITPMQRKMLDQAFVSSQRMVFLIADLLNVSRLKTGKFVIEPSPVNLGKTVADEIDQLKETAKNRELELVYDKPTDFPTLMIDETKIRQVIMNFIDNAIYYTPKGGTIRIELKDTPTTVELRVIDNGIGVPKREQPHLFTKFYRAGNARQTRPDGTGLGLFMAKKVVVAQGGAVIFDSTEGKGSTFGFIFPKARLVAPPAPQAVALHAR